MKNKFLQIALSITLERTLAPGAFNASVTISEPAAGLIFRFDSVDLDYIQVGCTV